MINNVEHLAGFGLLLRKYRKENNLTQSELAEIIGTSKPYITLIETGRRKNLNFKYIEKLANCFNLDKDKREEFYFNAGYSFKSEIPRSENLPSNKLKKYPYLIEILNSDPKDVKEEDFVRGLYDALKFVVNRIPKTPKEKKDYHTRLKMFEIFVMPPYKKK